MKIIFTDYVQPNLDLETRLIGQAGLSMWVADPQCISEDDVIRAVRNTKAEAIVSLYSPITEAVLSELPDLKIVSVPLVGVDAIDLSAARRHGVWIAHIPDAWVSEVAVHAVAMALALTRHLPFYDRAIRQGRWDYLGPGTLHRPTKMTFGLLGCGRIGRYAAACAAPSFNRVLAYDPAIPTDQWPAGIERASSFEELLRCSDVLSLHLPLTDETRHVIGASQLSAMKPGSLLVNVSRGALVDSSALIDALNSGQLAGAGLDVFEQEPPDLDDPLLHHPRTLVTPHAAYYSVEADEEGRSRAVQNIIAYHRTGRPNHFIVSGTR